MTTILSSVSGQFSKALILGAFFPTALFVVFAWLFLTPLIPTDWIFFAPLKALDPQWQLGALTLLTIILSGMMYNLNIPLLRVYEGYRWQNTSIGRWFTKRQEDKRTALRDRYNKLLVLGASLPGEDKHPYYDAVLREWNGLQMKLANDFPRTYSILPTRLGNVLRSAEEYPDYQYGIDAITLWPRMIAAIEEKYAAALDEARISLNFMVNSAFLSGLLAGLLLIVGLFNPVLLSDLAMGHRYLPWFFQIAVLFGVSYLFYLGAVTQAYPWGNRFKSVFDLYKSKLLSELGYKHDVSTRAEESKTWDLISRQILYGNEAGTDEPRIDYAPATATPTPVSQTFVKCKNPGDERHLLVTRGTGENNGAGTVTVYVSVKNISPQDRQPKGTIPGVTIVDKLPEGFDYAWATARVEDKRIAVVGTNPYDFSIGDVQHGKEVVLTYRMVQREKPFVKVQVGFWRGLLRSLLLLAR